LPPEALCDGIAFVSNHADPAPDLRPIRDVVASIWRGRLGAGPDGPHVLVVAFTAPVAANAAGTAPGLPLRATAGGALASFVEDLAVERAAPKPSAGLGWRLVELWWNGRRYGLALDTLQRISPAMLWSAPRLTIHAPLARAGLVGSAAPRSATRSDGLSRIAHARIALQREASDPVGDIEAGLRNLEERTRLSSIFRQVIGRGRRGPSEGDDGAPGAGDEREPGVMENLKGWLRWHTPLGAGLRGKFAERMNTVDRLFAAGDLDSALKLALALGAGKPNAKGGALPNAAPGRRTSLDLTFTGSGGGAPILGAATFEALRGRYSSLAQKLERDGDFCRAAYVWSKLLDDHRHAVLVLERGGLFREGAKLAMEAKLEPVLAIRLLFKADELAAALSLAKRAGCFDQLAEDSRGKDAAFHAYVVAAWTETLIAVGQPLRALQVTDRLAGEGDAPPPLLDSRRRWLAAAVALEEPTSPAPEVVARWLLMSPRDEGALSALEAFPEGSMREDYKNAGLYQAFSGAVRGMGEAPGEALLELLAPLARLADPARQEQSGFWLGPAQPVLEAYALSLIELVSERLGGDERDAIRSLLTHADLPVLAFDMEKLSKLHVRPPAKARAWRVPAPAAVLPAVRAACVLGTGHVLVWRESRLMQLLDRHGGVVWQQNVSDVAALVPIASGPNVIVIQNTADGAQQLTRFASHHRSFHPIGRVRLAAHHDLTSEGQWMVQIGGEIGALDLVKLCQPSPEIELLWSSQVTERLTAVAFGHSAGAPQWLTRDISEGRAGVLELWTMKQGRQLETTVCIPLSSKQDEVRKPADWSWAPEAAPNQFRTTDAARQILWTSTWTIETERRAIAYAAKRRALDGEGQDTFQSCDFGRPYIRADAGETVRTAILDASATAPRFTLEHTPDVPLICLARGAGTLTAEGKDSAQPGRIVFTDNNGRLFIVDAKTLNLVVV
jgi:hypothetical protein